MSCVRGTRGPPCSGAATADIIADLHDVPAPESAFDAILCTEVLEHVAEPALVVNELARLLRPGGRIIITVPFVIGLHEEPFDHARFTNYGLEHLLTNAGFTDVELRPLGGVFSVTGAVVQHLVQTILIDRGERSLARAAAWRLSRVLFRPLVGLARLDGFDTARRLPLGWAATATASTDDKASGSVANRV